MTVTIRDIAREAGVSIATVSRVINGSKEVSPELKERVAAIVRRTKFKPNPMARSLITKRTMTIGIIVTDISNAVIGELAKGINTVCEDAGYNLMMFESGGHRRKELQLLDLMDEKTVDGVLFAGVDVDTELGRAMEAKNYPIVLVTQESSDPGCQLPTVIHDNVAASRDATQFLIGSGHRRIAFIGGPAKDYSNVIKRRQGYGEALVANGLEVDPGLTVHGDFSFQSGFDCMRKLYEESAALPTAVLACSDTMALGAIRYLKHAGVQVPDEVSVMGFDDMDIAVYTSPELSTVRISYREEGAQAARLLFRFIDEEEDTPEIIYIPHSVIRRQSVARIG